MNSVNNQSILDIKLKEMNSVESVLDYLKSQTKKNTVEIEKNEKKYDLIKNDIFSLITATDDISILTPLIKDAFSKINFHKRSLSFLVGKKQTSSESINIILNDIKNSYFYLWTIIAKGTKLINPSLDNDIVLNKSKYESVSPKDICWIQHVWNIRTKSKCLCCGEVH